MFSDFRNYLPEAAIRDECQIEASEGSSIGDILTQLELPEKKPRVITVNDTNRKEDFILNDGDVLKIFPLATGG